MSGLDTGPPPDPKSTPLLLPVDQGGPKPGPAPGPSEIDLLLARADAEPTNFAAAEAALRRIDQSEIDAMLASGTMKDALGDDVLSVGAAGGRETRSQEELDKILTSATSAGPENSLGGAGLDAVLAPAESTASSRPATSADAAPVACGKRN